MTNKVTFENIKKVTEVVGEIGAQARLEKVIGIENAAKVWKGYCDVKRAKVPETVADKVLETLLELRELEMPVVPDREEGDSLFLSAYEAFPLKDGTVVPNGVTIKYSFGGRDYALSKTKKEYASNVLQCYRHTKNPDVRHRFEYAVNGHTFEDPRTALFTTREFYKEEPVFKELRKSGEVEWTEYNPYQGLDEEQVALLKAQTWDYELRHWGSEVVEAVEGIRPLMKAEPLKAKQLILLIADQLEDMTKLDVHQKRCGEWLEDPHCDDSSFEIELAKKEVRVSPKEREFRWVLKKSLANMAREEGAEKLLKWLNKWSPTETSKKPDIEGESFRLARAIGYSQACKLYCQRKFADRWQEALAILLGYNAEAENAYFASQKVLEALAEGCGLEEAIGRSTYDVFIDDAEKLEHGEIDKAIVLNWVKSPKLEKFNKMLIKIEKAYKEARKLQLETRQVEILAEFKELLQLKEAGVEIPEGRFQSLRKQQRDLSRKIEALQNNNNGAQC